MSGFPWREHRCDCGKVGVINFQGEMYCSRHIPFKDMAAEYLELLYDLMGKEWRDNELDQRFPTEEDFTWILCYYRAKDLYEKLTVETGLLMLKTP